MSEGCHDRFCYLTGEKPTGTMVTNGGCRCVTEQPARAALLRLHREIERLRAGYEAAKKNQRGAERAYEKAEAEIDRLRAALRRIRDEYWPVMDDVKYQSRDLCVAIEEAKEALGDG